MMTGNSQAYREGFMSDHNDNPYQPNTQEYNDFERGRSQFIRQYGAPRSSNLSGGGKRRNHFQTKYSNPQNVEIKSKGNAYAEAKGKSIK